MLAILCHFRESHTHTHVYVYVPSVHKSGPHLTFDPMPLFFLPSVLFPSDLIISRVFSIQSTLPFEIFGKTSQPALENKLKNTRKSDGSCHSWMRINICGNVSSVSGRSGFCSPFHVEVNDFVYAWCDFITAELLRRIQAFWDMTPCCWFPTVRRSMMPSCWGSSSPQVLRSLTWE